MKPATFYLLSAILLAFTFIMAAITWDARVDREEALQQTVYYEERYQRFAEVHRWQLDFMQEHCGHVEKIEVISGKIDNQTFCVEYTYFTNYPFTDCFNMSDIVGMIYEQNTCAPSVRRSP